MASAGDSGDKHYWLTRSVEERADQMELLRRINYGDQAAGRLQRVLEVIEGKTLADSNNK